MNQMRDLGILTSTYGATQMQLHSGQQCMFFFFFIYFFIFFFFGWCGVKCCKILCREFDQRTRTTGTPAGICVVDIRHFFSPICTDVNIRL